MNLIRNYEDEIILGALVVREPVVALTMLTSNLLPNPDMAVLRSPWRAHGNSTRYL